MIRLKKSVLHCKVSCTMLFRWSSPCLTLYTAHLQLRPRPRVELVNLQQLRPVARSSRPDRSSNHQGPTSADCRSSHNKADSSSYGGLFCPAFLPDCQCGRRVPPTSSSQSRTYPNQPTTSLGISYQRLGSPIACCLSLAPFFRVALNIW